MVESNGKSGPHLASAHADSFADEIRIVGGLESGA